MLTEFVKFDIYSNYSDDVLTITIRAYQALEGFYPTRLFPFNIDNMKETLVWSRL